VQATDTPTRDSPPPAPSGALADWLRLARTAGVGLITAHRLLEHFPGPQAIFAAAAAGDPALARHVKPAQLAALRRMPDGVQAELDAILAWQQTPGNRVLALDHPDYPAMLRHIPNPPLMLYLRGRAELLGSSALAMVGSRNASTQGVQNAGRMAQALSEAGLTIVSGLALGIDAAAHVGALRGPGSTVAVLGTGADRSYPARNQALAQQIAEQGCIVSEYALGTPPLADNFPRRNRIISGLARGVLVVEAALKSGSLITARLAAAQGRDVYAIPGSIHATLSKGCHVLIREGAKLVESAADILDDWHMLPVGYMRAMPDDSFVDRVLDALGSHPGSADELALRLGQEVADLQGQLLALELAGLLERLPGGMFQRVWR
jgi:DNA processing protein